jgi:hypothetical protein
MRAHLDLFMFHPQSSFRFDDTAFAAPTRLSRPGYRLEETCDVVADAIFQRLQFGAALLDPGEVSQGFEHELLPASVGITGLVLAVRLKKWTEVILFD